MKLSKKALTALKKALPHGSIKKIHEETGLSYKSVSDVLTGKSYNEKVIECAVKISEEAKAKQQAFENRINALI